MEIRTVDKIVLSLGIEVTTEELFDPHYLMRNLASLFGIPAGRMRVPDIVAGTNRRRLLQASVTNLVRSTCMHLFAWTCMDLFA